MIFLVGAAQAPFKNLDSFRYYLMLNQAFEKDLINFQKIVLFLSFYRTYTTVYYWPTTRE